jgi:DNA processing protein
MTDKFKAWLCLKSAFGTKPKTALELVKKYPHPEEYVGNPQHPIYEDDTIPPQIKEQLLSAVPHPREEQIAKLCEHYEINAIFYGDEDYPLALANIILPPLILYYRGDLLKALNNISLAVVGTRKPTAYGKNACSKLLAPVCQRGVTIVSGLAYGIDTVSHITALQNGAMTIAVLASGVENIYPPANRELAKEIINNGALVSEYEPGTKLESWNFPARNRIISALAPVTFVVEGSMTSGAMITAKHALEQNHDLIALPGEIYHPNAQGPNYLIKNGAQCITCPEDILYALGIEVEEREQLEFLPEISPDEQKIYDLFREEQRELSFDELLLKTGYSFGKLSTILLNLELKGLIIKSGGNTFLLS